MKQPLKGTSWELWRCRGQCKVAELRRPDQKPAERRRLRRRRRIGDAPGKARDEQDNNALAQSHVNEETDSLRIAFRQIVTELAEH